MGRLDSLPGIDDENTTRRNVLIGSGYGIVVLALIGSIPGVGDDDNGSDDNADDETDSQTDTSNDDNTDDQQGGQTDEDEQQGNQDDGSDADDEPEIALEDDYFGSVTEEPNPETFDPDEDLSTVTAWIGDTVDHIEFVLLEMPPRDPDAWADAAETAEELANRFFTEIEPMFFRETDPSIADGIPAWDLNFAKILDGPDVGLVQVLRLVQDGAAASEGEEEVAQIWLDDVGQGANSVLDDLEESDRYDYTPPEEIQ